MKELRLQAAPGCKEVTSSDEPRLGTASEDLRKEGGFVTLKRLLFLLLYALKESPLLTISPFFVVKLLTR